MQADSLEILVGPRPSRPVGLHPGVLLPRANRLGGRTRLLVYTSLLALALAVLVDVLHVIFGLAPSWETALHGPVVAGSNALASAVILVRAATARRNRPLWWLAAVGFALYSVGSVLWNAWLQFLPDPPNPSIADVFWLSMYPLLGGALVLSASRRLRGESKRVLVDALVATTAAVALCAAFIAPPLLHAADRNHSALVTDLMYPVADMAIGILVIALMSIRGWRVDRMWGLLIVVYPIWLLGDSMWALQISGDAATGSSAVTLCYLTGSLLLAAAVWQPEPAIGAPRERRASPVAPGLLAAIPPAILVYDHFSRISLTALLVTWVALLAAVVRFAVSMRDTLVLRDVERAAMTDELTELPNRRMFLTRLRDQVEALRRDGGTLTTLMLDLDNFKQLNDTLGHDAGDELLRLTGPRLAHAAGPRALVARLGGDEFAILLEPGSSRADAALIAELVLESFNQPLQVHGLALRLTASVGIASFPDDADTPETLLKRADVAMYEAKRSRHGWEYYSADRDANTLERLEMTGELAAALAGEEIEVAYQAIADTDTRRIRTAEALVRWRKPDGTLRPPSEFLEAAELAGLSRQLTRRVLKLALDEVSSWRAAGHMIAVSVNTMVADLLDDSFPDEVAAALRERELPGDALKIEVTESSIMANPVRVSSVLDRLRAIGVKIALDDFGTGYSSLTHLRQLPVDRLKIDRSFVTHMCCESTDAAIVYATIELAHKLNLLVIAEGVEDEATWQALLELGCDAVQGYGLNRPLQPGPFRELLAQWGTREPDAAGEPHLADSQSLPMPASTASGGSIA